MEQVLPVALHACLAWWCLCFAFLFLLLRKILIPSSVYTSQVGYTPRAGISRLRAPLPVTHFNWLLFLYSAVIAVLAGRLLFGYWKIVRLIHMSRVEFVKALLDGTFRDRSRRRSLFFKYIFWNKRVNATTQEGRQMLQHEMVHVQEKTQY